MKQTKQQRQQSFIRHVLEDLGLKDSVVVSEAEAVAAFDFGLTRKEITKLIEELVELRIGIN